MHFGIKSLLAAAVLGLSGLAAPAGAQDAQLVSYEELLDRVARLEQEMAEAPAPIAEAPPADESTDDGGYYFVMEHTFLTPYFSQNTSSVVFNGAGNAAVREFNWDLEYSPRFEIGNIDACTGTGWRARYWHFEHSEQDNVLPPAGGAAVLAPSGSGVAVPVPAGLLAQSVHSLRMSVADLEFLKRDMSADGGFTASVGLRYARIDNWLRGRAIAPGGIIVGNASYHNDFEGIGPTIAAEYLKRFECSYWGAFVNARGALLYGESNERNDVRVANVLLPAGSSRNVNDQDLVSVVEMQIGADYRRQTASCHEIFLRIALEAQYWSNAGSANADTGGGLTGNNSSKDSDLGFFGLSIATGLDW